MTHFLVAVHHRDDIDASLEEDDAMHRAIDILNDEMLAAGIRVFVGGLHGARGARSLRPESDGTVRVTEGPYLATGEHMGGFWVLDVADLDAALDWGRKAAIACRVPVEVRQFH